MNNPKATHCPVASHPEISEDCCYELCHWWDVYWGQCCINTISQSLGKMVTKDSKVIDALTAVVLKNI